MAIDRDIRELLYDHDCVIVPEWGGFLSHYRSARLDEARQLVHPPGKELGFNRNLLRNDGLLADHLAKRAGIGFDAATARVQDAVQAWKQDLDRKNRVELPLLGIFYRDADQILQFDPDRRGEFLKDAHGLRPVAAVPVERAVPVIPLPSPAVVEPLVEHVERRGTYLWAAALVAGVLFTAAAVWAYRMGANEQVQWSGFDPFGQRPERTYVAPAEGPLKEVGPTAPFTLPEDANGIQVLPLVPEEDLALTVDLGSIALADTTSVAVVAKATTTTIRRRFHVIGGCFAQPENAERLFQELVAKGHPATRLPEYGDLHPVAYGSYADRATALEALAQVRTQHGGSAWLLVR